MGGGKSIKPVSRRTVALAGKTVCETEGRISCFFRYGTALSETFRAFSSFLLVIPFFYREKKTDFGTDNFKKRTENVKVKNKIPKTDKYISKRT